MNSTLSIPEFTPEKLATEIPLTILAVDDSLVNQILIQKVLSKLGYSSSLASNGLEALLAAERTKFDLILMDLQMPELDGFEAASKIRQLTNDLNSPYIVALSADDSPESKSRFEDSGINDCLVKPVMVSEIFKLIKRVFSK